MLTPKHDAGCVCCGHDEPAPTHVVPQVALVTTRVQWHKSYRTARPPRPPTAVEDANPVEHGNTCEYRVRNGRCPATA